MTKGQLILINGLLLCAAALATTGLVHSRGIERQLPNDRPANEEVVEGRMRVRTHMRGTSGADPENLWSKNLFNPRRGPITEETDEVEPASSATADFELTGIGRIGERRAAIIIVKPRRSVRRRGGPPAPEPQPPKKIYSIGDEVGDTGYRLAAINFDKQEGICEVVLEDNVGNSLVLGMETDDKASLARAASAAASEEQTATVVTAAAETEKPSLPPGAPPPPPAPVAIRNPDDQNGKPANANGADPLPDVPVAEMTREQRLRWAIEMRQKAMRDRQKRQQNRTE